MGSKGRKVSPPAAGCDWSVLLSSLSRSSSSSFSVPLWEVSSELSWGCLQGKQRNVMSQGFIIFFFFGGGGGLEYPLKLFKSLKKVSSLKSTSLMSTSMSSPHSFNLKEEERNFKEREREGDKQT